MWTNSGANAGDRLILTKPIGTGVVATAIKFGRRPRPSRTAAIATMVELNRRPPRRWRRSRPARSTRAPTSPVSAVGHASEMALASGCVSRLDVASVPLLDWALDLVDRNTPAAGGRTTRIFRPG
jgi:selenide,water dikinase